MDKFKKKKWFMGIDISKDFIDAALMHEEEPDRVINDRFTNDLKGFEGMQEWCIKHEVKLSECLICMEHTGPTGCYYLPG